MRRRIVVLAVAAAVLAISLFGLPLAAGVAKYNLDDERAELERVAARAALSVSDNLSDTDSPVLQSDEPETGIGLYSPTGQLRSGSGPSTSDQVVRQAAADGDAAAGGTDSDIAVAVPIEAKGTLVGIVRASTPRSEVTLRTASVWLAMTGLAVLAVGLTWLIARRMAARLAKPLEDLSGVAQVLGDGDFTARTSRTGIAEIDMVGASLDSTAQRIGDTLEKERAFSRNASHQLRTPLAGLQLQLEAALESPGADLRAAIRDGLDEANLLEQTINDLLALARDDSRAQTSVADLDDLLDEVRRSWQGPLASQGRALQVSARRAPQPKAAQAAARQILNVLLDNALTHGSGTVTVTARDAGQALAIDVADEGTGIGEDDDPFTRRVDAQDGHGIGLALARNLAGAEQGRLFLSSTAPTCFTLLLPVAAEPE
jgi:signal transduction histidine kinase